MKTQFSFSVLRYIHDPLSQEFVNIGVVVYAPAAQYLEFRCSRSYGRLSKMFGTVDGERYRQTLRYLESQFDSLGKHLRGEPPLIPWPETVEKILAQVLPSDDSGLRFSPAGAGITSDPEKNLRELYARLVEKYAVRADVPSRDDEDIRRLYRQPLENRGVLPYLAPKEISTPDYSYRFKEAWKNKIWHVFEPVSLDLIETSSILDKANTWLGRITSLSSAEEKFKTYLLLGEPREQSHRDAVTKAINILHRMPGEHVFVREHEAESFASELKSELAAHL